MFVLLLACVIGLYGHEQVHILVNNQTGQNSTLKFGLYDGWLPAIGVEKTGAVESDLTNAELAHSFNESINYNLTPLLFGIMMVLIMGFSEVLKKLDVKK